MKPTQDMLFDAAVSVRDYFTNNDAAAFCFHDYAGTLRIVQACSIISVSEDLSGKDRLLALLSAWFLNTGYVQDALHPKERAAERAVQYFQEKGLDPDLVETIRETILDTRLPAQPTSAIAQVLCDSETAYLGEKHPEQYLELLRRESESIRKQAFSEAEWEDHVQELFARHVYFTQAARDRFDKRKQKYRAGLGESLQQGVESHTHSAVIEKPQSPVETAGMSLEGIKLERGVESLFRNTSRNQMRMIQLADYKANLVISINAIIVTVVLSVLVVRLDANPYLEIPTLLMVITSLSTILIALSASRPKVKLGKTRNEEIKGTERNLLFFGDFYNRPLGEYKKTIRETMVNRIKLYDSLSHDIYFQGQLLVRKYRYLILAYDVFAWGLVISVLSFIVSFLIHLPAAAR